MLFTSSASPYFSPQGFDIFTPTFHIWLEAVYIRLIKQEKSKAEIFASTFPN